MDSSQEQVDEQFKVKQYKIQYPLAEYTFPREARIHADRFDDRYLHLELMDGRILSNPLSWIPTLYNAEPEERAKFQIDRERMMLV